MEEPKGIALDRCGTGQQTGRGCGVGACVAVGSAAGDVGRRTGPGQMARRCGQATRPSRRRARAGTPPATGGWPGGSVRSARSGAGDGGIRVESLDAGASSLRQAARWPAPGGAAGRPAWQRLPPGRPRAGFVLGFFFRSGGCPVPIRAGSHPGRPPLRRILETGLGPVACHCRTREG
ncbi:hypothetical protein ISF6_0044 [Piscinibacter sakaiensis]|uniref:Uncharacterized protein n=1 Tax=Piscinibacter sakaiensis TaxID=1547922 RepID=A0A0K8NTA6_PISS1|nr:hypothetical protein ISF6_0044 [Piscinibacter sakaiensis]